MEETRSTLLFPMTTMEVGRKMCERGVEKWTAGTPVEEGKVSITKCLVR